MYGSLQMITAAKAIVFALSSFCSLFEYVYGFKIRCYSKGFAVNNNPGQLIKVNGLSVYHWGFLAVLYHLFIFEWPLN